MNTKKSNRSRLREVTVLIPENATDDKITELKNIIEKYATIRKIENLGVKTSPYPMAKNGVEYLKTQYIFVTIETSNAKCRILSDKLYKNDNAIRHLIATVLKVQ